MSQAHSENGSTQDVQEHLEAYEKMNAQHRRYTSLKQNVEKERESVHLHIYKKVKAEYEEKMLAVEQDLERHRELLRSEVQELLDRRSELSSLCGKDTERLEEIDFRTRVGEFTEAECGEERNEIEQRTKTQSDELAQLEKILDRCTRAGLLAGKESSPDPAAPPEETETEPAPDRDGSEQASHPPSQVESCTQDPEPSGTAQSEAEEQDFEVVEEDCVAEDAIAGAREAPVVHCPPDLSTGRMPARGETTAGTGRSGPHVEISEYVTGYLVALEGSRHGERFPMISSNITLGSSPGIDIRLSDSGIANFHARILYKERKHFLENLDHMGRSFVNGVQATDIVELKDGDVVRLGDIKMQVEYASAQTTHAN